MLEMSTALVDGGGVAVLVTVTVNVLNTPGGGAAFVVHLPLEKKATEESD